MWSLFACESVGVVVGGVNDPAFVAFDGAVTGAGRVSCGMGRGSVAIGVGASVTALGSTEENLGVANGSEGCTEGASNGANKSRARGD